MIITTRNDLGKLYNNYFQKGIGVEIGVQNGFNLKQICSQWDGKVIGVDIWEEDEIYENAKRNLEGCNFQLIRATSVMASVSFATESLDWIYIDASHNYEDIKEDYNAWYPKVRKGGVISFHDYGNNEFANDVKRFIDQLGIGFFLTTDDFWEGVEYQTAWFIKGDEKKLTDVI